MKMKLSLCGKRIRDARNFQAWETDYLLCYSQEEVLKIEFDYFVRLLPDLLN